MAKLTKRFKAMQGLVEPGKTYPLSDALSMIKDNAKAKFVESIDVAVRLGIDARKSDQGVRGSSLLPHGTGKTIKVAVFCPAGEKAEAAKAAGADAVGMEDLAERLQGGDLDFGRVIATPDAMRVVGKLGQLLGPRGLMPNPKDGSVTADVVTAVNNAKAGQVKFRNDKAGIIHASVGKADFDVEKLADNINALVSDLLKAKPATAKGQYLQKVSVSSTMGIGIAVDTSTLSAGK
ncbi:MULTISPECIES: 50S ribosomal protein L1 [Oleiagrimonas]|uniref:Large ribosomal subunit protein uL1 n=1 Tax=Oleiagrimonas citrea TaxID=1665687 RepID=A0A846ZRZ3_9GAMM|nr:MULTISPECIES: 50S ribosomal protein L1 [Oleiagrimonas]NKZ40223.1 50S ribosomal protein L1 [Oleiagrimonas citrea]RAP59298.1 50S ribosomal protein L1 [Oleiagrimonas sp. MCCC 1A03011]